MRRARKLFLESLEPRQLMAANIIGTIYEDLDRNGVRNNGENGVGSGWTPYLDVDNDGVLSQFDVLVAINEFNSKSSLGASTSTDSVANSAWPSGGITQYSRFRFVFIWFFCIRRTTQSALAIKQQHVPSQNLKSEI